MKDGHIETYTGKLVNVTDPIPETLDIRDIAHGLSNVCRFSGQCRFFYSVAEHCTLVYKSLEWNPYNSPNLMRAALLHDASEAYITDLPRTVKALCPDYKKIEKTLQTAIYKKFNINLEELEKEAHALKDLKAADSSCLRREAIELMPYNEEFWKIYELPADVQVRCLTPHRAEMKFLHYCRKVGLR